MTLKHHDYTLVLDMLSKRISAIEAELAWQHIAYHRGARLEDELHLLRSLKLSTALLQYEKRP